MGDETGKNNAQRDKENSDSKTCPILTLGFSVGSSGIMEVDCLKDGCAWSDAVSDRCSVVEIAFELAEISVVIRDIRKQLTEI